MPGVELVFLAVSELSDGHLLKKKKTSEPNICQQARGGAGSACLACRVLSWQACTRATPATTGDGFRELN